MFKITETKQKTSEIWAECNKLFKCWSYYSPEQMDKDFPIPKKTTHYFRKEVEADEVHKNKSANDLEKEGVKGITLRERLLLEIQYFKETGKHLDIKNITLCSGSRWSAGFVPDAYWYDDNKFYVHRCYVDIRNDYIRAREQFLKPFSSSLVPLDKDSKKIAILEERVTKIENWIDFWETVETPEVGIK